MLPETLKYVNADSFSDCDSLGTIYVEDGCEADLFDLNISDSTHVGPLPGTMVGGVRVWDLRKLKDVVIPEGTERIGNCWFWGSGVGSVEIPASVKCISTSAFCNCKSLRYVEFAEGSQLRRLGVGCFRGSGIEEIKLLNTLREIGERVFECDNLKTIYVEDEREASFVDAHVPTSTHIIPISTTLVGDVSI